MKRIKIAFNKLKTNTIKKIKKIKRDHLIREYFKNNVLFLTFVITMVINSTILRFFCMHSIENYLSWKAVLADTVVVMIIGSFGYLIKPKNRFIYYMGFAIFLTAAIKNHTSPTIHPPFTSSVSAFTISIEKPPPAIFAIARNGIL